MTNKQKVKILIHNDGGKIVNVESPLPVEFVYIGCIKANQLEDMAYDNNKELVRPKYGYPNT